MKFLGLDISSVSTGWALVDYENKRIVLQDYGLITSTDTNPLGTKLCDFASGLNAVLGATTIDWVGIEDTYNKNVVTVKTLSKFCGVAIKEITEIQAISRHYSDELLKKAFGFVRKAPPQRGIYICTPSQIMRLCGVKWFSNRHDKKIEVINWCNRTFSTEFNIGNEGDDDRADAVSTAYATIRRLRELSDDSYWSRT